MTHGLLPQFSVLMSVYERESPENLRMAIDSLFEQSLRPNEVVVVKDGPLTLGLDEVIEVSRQRHAEIRVVQLEQNRGLGAALDAGMEVCSHDLIARMDSDDVSLPNRFELQISLLSKNMDIAAVGSWVAEFKSDTSEIEAVKKVPCSVGEVSKFARFRCPINHPSVVFRKKAIQSVGGYVSTHLQEDYYLWARLLMAGYGIVNIPEPLVLMRTGDGLYARRGGLRYAIDEARLMFEFYNIGFINLPKLFINLVLRFSVRIIPNNARKFIYLCFARSLGPKTLKNSN